jgi:hypothetical protein
VSLIGIVIKELCGQTKKVIKMASKDISPVAPKNIRRICSEWSHLSYRPTMSLVAEGRSDYYLIDLLFEVISCLNSYILSTDREKGLRKLEEWVLAKATEWTVDEERGVELDRSKGIKSGRD